MVSTLKVQTIQIPNSDSDIITFDTSGNVTLNSNKTSTGFGITAAAASEATVTVKYNYDHSGAAVRSSTNVSSIGDDATGKFSVNLTSNLADTTGSLSCAHNYYDPGTIAQTASIGGHELGIESTSELEGSTYYTNTLYDVGQNFGQAYGDLA